MTAEIVLYTTRYCPYCMRARRLLDSKHLTYTDIAVDKDPALRQQMAQRAGDHRVPQIWIGETHVGGCDELFQLEQQQKLDDLVGRTQE